MFEQRESILEAITWDGEDRCVIVQNGWTFAGAKRKDFFNPDDDWEARLVPGARLRLWTIQWSRVAGFEWWDPEPDRHGLHWRAVWFCGNDFQTKAEREAGRAGYQKFIEDEGRKIAKLIDEGHDLAAIEAALDPGHSGNTFGWAMALGIRDAENREHAEHVRREHNTKLGNPEATGTINPALLTFARKDS